MGGVEAESFVEPQSRVDFYDGQAHRLIETCSFANQAIHHLQTDQYRRLNAALKLSGG